MIAFLLIGVIAIAFALAASVDSAYGERALAKLLGVYLVFMLALLTYAVSRL